MTDENCGSVFDEVELIEFFESEPQLDDNSEERDFFGTQMFSFEHSDIRLEFSVDSHTPNATIQLFKGSGVIFNSTVEVKEYRLTSSEEARKLIVKSNGFSTILELPAIRIAVVENS